MALVTANNENFYELIEKEGTVVEFWAPWCGYCRRLSPVLKQIAGEYPDLTLVQVNIDDNEELTERYGVETIPSLMVFHDKNAGNHMDEGTKSCRNRIEGEVFL